MKRPTKFSIMRHNRCLMRTARMREEARELGYDEAGDDLPPGALLEVREAFQAKYGSPRRWWWPLNWVR